MNFLCLGLPVLFLAADVNPGAAQQAGAVPQNVRESPHSALYQLDRLRALGLGSNGAFEAHSAIATWHQMHSEYEPAVRQWRLALIVAVAEGKAHREMFALNALALSQIVAGDYDAGGVSAERLLKLARVHHAPGYESEAQTRLGTISRRRGRLDDALSHHQSALNVGRKFERPAAMAQALTNLGTVYRDMGRYSEALDRQMQALELRKQLGPGYRVDVPYRNIGLLYREIEDSQSARENLEHAIDAAKLEFDPFALSSALGSYATLLNDLGEWDQAQSHAQRALDTDLPLGNKQAMALEYLELARSQIGLRRFADASMYVNKALRLGEEMSQADVIGRALLYRGDLLAAEGNPAAAESTYSQSVEHLTRAQLKPQLHAAYLAIERLLERRGALSEALLYSRQRAALREELLGLTSARRLAILELKQERERTDRQLEILRMDNQVQELGLRTESLRQRIAIGALVALLSMVGFLFWRLSEVRRLNAELASKNNAISSQDSALRAVNARLSAQASELYHAATVDPLTQVFNRGHLMQMLSKMFDLSVKTGREMTLLLIDLDRFKPVNDNYGHQFGDRVLTAAVAVFREELRENELLGRYGGEEFIVGLLGHEEDQALGIAERLRLKLQQRMSALDGRRLDITTSIGVARVGQLRQPSVSALISAADDALYSAKRLGRNRVESFSTMAPGGFDPR
ncbi:MAG: tetratricopeptide repeat-containing diguanylate cyclase [Pseudomonadota bacterium]|nr:tetratricopeptide repeat-containing diguanylate cyclase [Pseudomonadota bacterium]